MSLEGLRSGDGQSTCVNICERSTYLGFIQTLISLLNYYASF